MTIRKVPKPWGEEIIFAHTTRYAGKVLRVRAGESLSLQYHERKDETLYLYEGRIRLFVEGPMPGAEREVGPGEAFRFEAGTRHRIAAITDAVLFEVSTPELDDVVRLEDHYGRRGTTEP
jgi:mannose-6-phosphate isomerase